MSTLLLPLIFAAGVCSGQGLAADAWRERLEPDPRQLAAEIASPGAPALVARCELPQPAGDARPGS